jgi:hypothetical protein
MGDSEYKSGLVRPVSRATKFTKIRALDCFESVHQRILDGCDSPSIAKFIQEERGEYLDAARTTVISALNYYRSSLPPGELVAKRLPGAFNDAVKKLAKSVDEVKELEWLTRFQKRRLRIDGDTETKINKLLPTMTQEVRAHVEVLRTLASVKMDLGLNKRHLGSLEVDATLVADVMGRYGTASVAKVLQSPDSRQKVMGVAERFLALAQREMNETDSQNVVDAAPLVPKAPPAPEASQVDLESEVDAETGVESEPEPAND